MTIIDGTRIVGTTENRIKAVVALMQENYSKAALMIFEGLPNIPIILKMIQEYVTKENYEIIINKLVKGISEKQFSTKSLVKEINEQINKGSKTKPDESKGNQRKPAKRGEHVINNDVLKVTFIFFN
jgi:hypothetical protein